MFPNSIRILMKTSFTRPLVEEYIFTSFLLRDECFKNLEMLLTPSGPVLNNQNVKKNKPNNSIPE